MDQRRSIFASFVCLMLLTVAAFGQPEAKAAMLEPSFDVELHLVIGSNDSVVGAAMPSNLASVSKQIKSSFGLSNYRLASSFFGRISNNGDFEYKSPSSIFGQDSQSQFLDWSISNLRAMPTANGGKGFQAKAFRFGARVPVTIGTTGDSKVTNYESVGIAVKQLGLSNNTPTLVGTLNLPGAGGTIFLIMTVRSVD